MITGLIEIEILIPISILTWILWKSWTHRLDPPYCDIFKTRNTDLQFRVEEEAEDRKLQSVMRVAQT